jgi:Dullard-like phosphatase family protein
MSRKLLILDVDETLIHADYALANEDFKAGPFSVIRRPYLDEFLDTVAGIFDLAVWSSGSSMYVQTVVDKVCQHPLKFVYAVDRCTRQWTENAEAVYLKDLKKVKGYELSQILIVDDSPEKLKRHYGNLVRISPFTGDRSDDALKQIIPFLVKLNKVDDVRTVEKRGWYQHEAKVDI